MSRFAFVASALMLIAAPAAAQSQAGIPKQAAEATDVNKIVCQKEEQVGSRLNAKKICLTVKEWRERAALNREETERVQRDSGFRSSGS